MRELFFFDIETVGNYPTLEDLKESNQKEFELFQHKYEKMKWDEKYDSIDDAYLNNAGIISTFGKIVCISCGYKDNNGEMRISSIYGDESYGATAMIWSNLRQFSLNGSYTKVHMEQFQVSSLNHGDHTHYSKTQNVSVKDPIDPPTPKLSHITSASVGYMNNFGNGAVMANMMKIKPTKYGTFGGGLNMGNMFGDNTYQMTMVGYNVLYTNQVMLNPRINYAPAFICTQTPFVTRVEWVTD